MHAGRTDGGDQGAKDGGDDGDADDDGHFVGIHRIGDGVKEVNLRVPHHDAPFAKPGVQFVDVMHNKPAEPPPQQATDNADGHAIAEEDAGDARAGSADALDDADVLGLLHDDHVEDAEDEEDGHDADHAEENRHQAFFLFHGADEGFVHIL